MSDQAVEQDGQVSDEAAVDEATEVEAAEEPQEKPSSEARLRKRAQQAEAERDGLAQIVSNLQRAQVESMLGDLKPQALWATGVELTDLVADDGTVNPAKVSEAVQAAREALGIPSPQKGNWIPQIGRQPSEIVAVDRWADAFSPKRR